MKKKNTLYYSVRIVIIDVILMVYLFLDICLHKNTHFEIYMYMEVLTVLIFDDFLFFFFSIIDCLVEEHVPLLLSGPSTAKFIIK